MSLVSEQWAASRANLRRVFFIDSENGITGLIEGVQYLNSTDKVIVFHRDDIPQGTRARICKTPATVEWVACVDPKMKNSMDVQIIAELPPSLKRIGSIPPISSATTRGTSLRSTTSRRPRAAEDMHSSGYRASSASSSIPPSGSWRRCARRNPSRSLDIP